LAFLVGTLALAGIPIFAGFWSKDAILASALADDSALGWILFVAGLTGTLLTGAYAFRLYFRVFHGERGDAAAAHGHGHGEGPVSMLAPVGVLAIGATIGGLLSIPGVWHPFTHWVEESAEPLVEPSTGEEYLVSAIAVALALVGFAVARRAFAQDRQLVTQPDAWRWLEHKFYFDELYDTLFYRPAVALSNALRRNVEEPVIEGSLDEIGSGTLLAGGELGRVQTGLLRTYALAITFAVVVLVVVFVAVR
ncbi:MAG: proton-conducting transporter membrane subunit, partial [Gaiellaceae bacterium]